MKKSMLPLRSALLFTIIASLQQLSLRAQPLNAQSPDAYAKEIEAWHAGRIAELKSPDGWLNLVGLYWLREGRNTFGSALDNTVVFPFGTIAPSAGYFQRDK